MDDKLNLENIGFKNTQDTLEDVYNDLYKSLGVEPGLLSKSAIGRKIEQKYRDDSIAAHVYALEYNMQNIDTDKKEYAEYIKQSPLASSMNTIITDESKIPDGENVVTLCGHKFYVREDNDDHIDKNKNLLKMKLVDLLMQYQMENNLKEYDMVEQIQEYLGIYTSDYRICNIKVHHNKKKEGE